MIFEWGLQGLFNEIPTQAPRRARLYSAKTVEKPR